MFDVSQRRLCDSRTAVHGSCAITLILGLFFIFVWAPHPWGHEGFDHYHELARAVASGQMFPTLDRPWGYAYFLAAFYRAFGDRPWIPLVAQAILNAAIPLLVFVCARRWFDRRTAVLAALITSICSFNTVYASTQSSDALCTVLFMAAVAAFAIALDRERWIWFAIAGALAGLAPQFRPNLILVPVVLAAYALLARRTRKRFAQAAVLISCAALVLTPWTVRNYRLTGTIIPTSVHGGVQLWYGTLQMGPYLNSLAYNPRTIFDGSVFEYTSLNRVPLVVSAETRRCAASPPQAAAVVYWTNRDPRRLETAGVIQDRVVQFEIPAPAENAVVYYYLRGTWLRPDGPLVQTTPAAGAAAPLVYFVSQDHLGDLDAEEDFLDSFDLIRIVRHVVWNEPLRFAERLKAAGIGERDVEGVVERLGRRFVKPDQATLLAGLKIEDGSARLSFFDGSTMTIPRAWQELITDIRFDGPLAVALMASKIAFSDLVPTGHDAAASSVDNCARLEGITVNHTFYRQEPHMMQRYLALSLDNIRRAPAAFLVASLYRALRVFVIWGTDDPSTAWQFRSSRQVYALAAAATATCLILFISGAAIAWRRGDAILLPLLLVLYIPITIAPMLTNMRYAVTVQPLIFMFVAVAIISIGERARRSISTRSARLERL